jgi:hypothetical protein
MRAGLALAAVTSGSDRARGAVWPERSGGLASWSDPCGNSVGRGLCGQGVVPTMSVFVCVGVFVCPVCDSHSRGVVLAGGCRAGGMGKLGRLGRLVRAGAADAD